MTDDCKQRTGAHRGIKLALMIKPSRTERLRLAAQMGLRYAIADVKDELCKVSRGEYLATVRTLRAHYQSFGLAIAGLESHPVPAEKIKLGLAGRDEEIENYCTAIEAAGANGIPMICYNFMAGLGWYRTSACVAGRGGALVSEFDRNQAEQEGPTPWGKVSEDLIWNNLEYFLKAVMPVAERAGVKMALHPDDSPVSPLRGLARILVSAQNFRRVLGLLPSPMNGITFCQANFKLMGEDTEALAREWREKIFFVHFRDVMGTRDHFVETFHDEGPTDMGHMLEAYNAAGFDGPMRPDHAPTMEGESNDRPGYAMMGKIFAIGYMKGLMEARGIPYE